MPYHRNADFRDFYHDLSWEKMQSYFRCLFRALRDVHARGIIHRDVKPANFLFDPEAGVGVLCDFGLAQRLEESDPESHYCHHSSSTASHPHGKITPAAELPPSIRRQVGEAKFEAKRKSTWPSDRIGYLDNDTRQGVFNHMCSLVEVGYPDRRLRLTEPEHEVSVLPKYYSSVVNRQELSTPGPQALFSSSFCAANSPSFGRMTIWKL